MIIKNGIRLRIAAENACREGESIHNMVGVVTSKQ